MEKYLSSLQTLPKTTQLYTKVSILAVSSMFTNLYQYTRKSEGASPFVDTMKIRKLKFSQYRAVVGVNVRLDRAHFNCRILL